ncbi:MAG: flavin reductase [Christensenellales bacterium]|jgi:flavorubredoxin/flavin reductase (DIM6/NTAB) family NADH-FMN oxidoreductase RutF/rubredoxin
MTITQNIAYVGVNDHLIDLFEGQYAVKNGMAYNSYLITDEKIAVFDSVDRAFGDAWLQNIKAALKGRKPNYLIVSHMEPDHSANIVNFLNQYPDATVVATAKAFTMMDQFFGKDAVQNRLPVKEGDSLSLGKHQLSFITAPMVHWPEVLMTYDQTDKALFSADAFGKFGANDVQEPWLDEARRYYIGIVGKYGQQVQAVLKKAAKLDIQIICPLHGPVLSGDLSPYLEKYNIWSGYQTESEGVLVAYTSVYGHTKEAVDLLVTKLKQKGAPQVKVYDLARCDMSEAVTDAFRFGRIVLATTTYNADIFPFMRAFIDHLKERNFRQKQIGFIENGSWALMAYKTMKGMLETCRNLSFTQNNVHILSALSEENKEQIEKLSDELCMDYLARKDDTANKNDLSALFKIGYGLYVVTSSDGAKDNGAIINTVTQVTNTPNRIAVCINKANYTHDLIQKTGLMNINCLSVDAPFSVFERFGFQSGRTVDKFSGIDVLRSDNGLVFLPKHINAMMSLKVESYVDLDTHGMFICTITEARVLSDKETMTYTYYQEHVKPKPQDKDKKGWVCKICGYIYEGDPLPDDFICPLCKHGAIDFERLP